MPVSLHDLRAGTDVVSRDGHKLGSLHRMVLKRSDLTLTHVVVDIGFLRSGHHLWEGGLGLDYDRIVPVDQIHAASDKRVELRLTAAEFKDVPEYTQERYEGPQDFTPNEYDISDIAVRAEQISGFFGSTPGAWIAEKLNKPLNAVDIKEGTPVWRAEPHEKLGDIMRLLLDDGRLRAFVIRRGFLFHHDVVLPVRYVSELFDDLVHADISDAALGQLREYKEAVSD
ncbi:MAG TPA: hypothetical protein VI876_06430 [Dehalococcoidia bacterium]|nr:hypothetical protein [Dehalococcoidia bacterium]